METNANENSNEYSPLTHQVAGCHSGTPSNILVNTSGQILKPYKPISNPTFNSEKDAQSITNPTDLVPVTLNELEFYKKLEKSTEPDLEQLRKISPKYFGSKMINDTDHLLLEDFTYGMTYPCVMDLKIGKDRYYPGRSAEKAKQDNIKYPCLQEYGFCIAGIKVSNPSTGDVEYHHMPKVTRKFSSEEVAEHIRKFMHCGESCGSNLSNKLQEGGEAILNWSLTQRSILLRGSSLLLVYDAGALNSEGGNGDLRARVGMIDFAHVFHSFGHEDTNYINGMKNLVHLLKTGKLP